jgi:hypothetical protein
MTIRPPAEFHWMLYRSKVLIVEQEIHNDWCVAEILKGSQISLVKHFSVMEHSPSWVADSFSAVKKFPIFMESERPI